MRRDLRLRATADFRRVRDEGRSWAHPFLILQAAPSNAVDGRTRVGVSASKKVGGAVIRNRMRRRVREAVRLRYARLAPGWDLVFIVRPALVDVGTAALGDTVETLLARAKLWQAVTPADRPSETAAAPAGRAPCSAPSCG